MPVMLVDFAINSTRDQMQTALLAQGLQDRGEALLLLCPAGSPVADMAKEHHCPVHLLPQNQSSLRQWISLRRLIREHHISLIHTLDEKALMVPAFLRKRQGVPLVHTLGLSGKKPSRGYAWAMKQVDALVDIGFGVDALQQEMGTPKHGGPDMSLLKTILPGIPLEGPTLCPPHHERQDGRFIFVGAGMLTPQEDWNSLLQAMACLQNMDIDLPPWEVRILGIGDEFDALLHSAEAMGVHKRLGLLGTQDWRTFLPEADAVLVPAAAGAGNVPLILLAWQCGLPVACTALPAHQALGEDKVSLLLTPPANPVALAGAMLRLMQDTDKRQSLAQNGHNSVGKFSLARMAEAYSELYVDVCNKVSLAGKGKPA